MREGIAIKSGKDWSGRMVNISTTNVLAEQVQKNDTDSLVPRIVLSGK
jgi:hypothetical protein